MDRLRTNVVFHDRRFTVTVVQSLQFRTGGSKRGRILAGSLKPIAVIVTEPERSYVLDMDEPSADIDSAPSWRSLVKNDHKPLPLCRNPRHRMSIAYNDRVCLR
jgi:hypothetical protein